MASLASAARDIPQALARDNLTVVAGRGDQATAARSHTLPTPPNSISPALPARGLKAQLQKAAKLDPIDSDLDLRDAAHGVQRSPSPPSDAAGAITSSMLSKHHLPEILLNHGPLAIRHIMGYLTTSVPGFPAIPPTKARRLVVGALEGRGGEGGGVDGDVQFEKVGWGRWDARRRGQAARTRQATPPSSYTTGIPITKAGGRLHDRPRKTAAGSSGYESPQFSHDDFDMVPENEADNMSMDEYESASCSEAPDDDVLMNDDPEDVTDDEDWGAMGAAALRADSYPNMAAALSGSNMAMSHGYNPASLRSFSGMARAPQPTHFDFSKLPMAGTSDAQEREAVEALLRLGSV
jgi:hypothetical protein